MIEMDKLDFLVVTLVLLPNSVSEKLGAKLNVASTVNKVTRKRKR